MRRFLWLLLILTSCASEDAPPSDLLDRNTFKKVLAGAQLIEARVNHELTVVERADSPVRKYYEELFTANGVTEKDYKRTFDWYAAHPKELKVIYEEVLTDIQHQADSTVHAAPK